MQAAMMTCPNNQDKSHGPPDNVTRHYMHGSMTLLLAYLNNRLQLDFSPQTTKEHMSVFVVQPIVIKI